MRLRKVASWLGTTLAIAGALILLFAAYLLWGTGLFEANSQKALRSAFLHSLPARLPVVPTTTAPATKRPAIPRIASGAAKRVLYDSVYGPPPPEGAAIAIIDIPSIGVDKAVVQGVGESDLEEGPGHYPGTPMPGELGNSAIAGHRTTFGGPFYRLGDLSAGDSIWITTKAGSFHYVVRRLLVVSPNDTSVVGPMKGAWLTLTTCDPPFSAAMRLVVQASLVGKALPAPSWVPAPLLHTARNHAGRPTRPIGATPEATTAQGATNPTPYQVPHPYVPGGGSLGGTIASGLIELIVAAGISVAWKRSQRWGKLALAVLAVPLLAAGLFFFFTQLNGLLPQSF
jgi:sortase A